MSDVEMPSPHAAVTQTDGDEYYEVVTAYWCDNCETMSTESSGPLYECRECGHPFNRENSFDGESHRCPDCRKFSARVADSSCIECGEAEAEKCVAYECRICGDLVAVEDWGEHAVDCQADNADNEDDTDHDDDDSENDIGDDEEVRS